MGRGKPFKQSVKRLVNAGVIPRPVWLDVVEATRPPFQPKSVTKSFEIRYPEDDLRAKYLENNPELRRIPINLKAPTIPERHVADRFVTLQMKLVREKSMSEKEAYKKADEMINERKLNVDVLFSDDLSGPLSDAAIENESARIYLASVKDSERDKRLHKAILDDSITSTN